MSQQSAIEWTDATWNPVRGCTKISPGCAHCYAETFAERFRGVQGHPYEQGFDLRLAPDKLDAPLRWKKPRMIFVNSMSDLFHEDVPDDYIDKVFAVMALCPQHTFQVLTKRAERMRDYLCTPGRDHAVKWATASFPIELSEARRVQLRECDRTNRNAEWWPLDNVWLGVSVENRKHGLPRVEHLVRTPAAVRFLSIEPLLEAVDLSRYLPRTPIAECEPELLPYYNAHCNLGWVIVGGESGPGARPMHPDWVRPIQKQCVAAGVPFFFKQWGEFAPLGKTSGLDPDHHYPGRGKRLAVRSGVPMDEPTSMFRLGKHAAGRLLDGREWNEMPARKGMVTA